jgi:hypothetical protein
MKKNQIVIVEVLGVKKEAIFSHMDEDMFHCYMNDKDVGKKKYRTIGYENCSVKE